VRGRANISVSIQSSTYDRNRYGTKRINNVQVGVTSATYTCTDKSNNY